MVGVDGVIPCFEVLGAEGNVPDGGEAAVGVVTACRAEERSDEG
jgi:hypothetical protein